MNANEVLSLLLEATPQRTKFAPKDCRGIYGLVDHFGDIRYIGSTSALNETFYKRIHHRHRTGSETYSHYFSRMYNTGRMWRLRSDPITKADGDIAKKLRNAFIAEYCRAVWVPLSDDQAISELESEVLSIAPSEAIAWNRHGMHAYDEPAELVDATISRLRLSSTERAALDRQRARFLGGVAGSVVRATALESPVPPLPSGPFRFVALDVETANNDRGSICQIGVACVRRDDTIETWGTYVDPQTNQWVFSGLHGITEDTVVGAPDFAQVLAALRYPLEDVTVYQHSGFDRSAIRKACAAIGCEEPAWEWHDSVSVARRAWPELKGNGGHGLASLKTYLGLSFDHHDAREDARAAAEVVLRAEQSAGALVPRAPLGAIDDRSSKTCADSLCTKLVDALRRPTEEPERALGNLLGQVVLTDGNINNKHLYLTALLRHFPTDCIGGSNKASAAPRSVTIDWGGSSTEVTDIDGTKNIFRKRGWVRQFFNIASAQSGDRVTLYSVGPYAYKVRIER